MDNMPLKNLACDECEDFFKRRAERVARFNSLNRKDENYMELMLIIKQMMRVLVLAG